MARAIMPSLTTMSTLLGGWTAIEPLTPVPLRVAWLPDQTADTPYLRDHLLETLDLLLGLGRG
jgi:hypothetical protein